MGLLDAVRRVLPGGKQRNIVSASIPYWQAGTAQLPDTNYDTFAREGYSKNELVFACIEELASSAAEPGMAAFRRTGKGLEQVDSHPILTLLDRPNPFMSRYDLWSTIIMHLSIAGNAYIEKVRSEAGRVVELWLMRPDRVRIVPSAETYIDHYTYQMGAGVYRVEAKDVIHFRNRHPLNDYYGMPPLMAISGRVDIDNYMRDFVKSFFLNAGVPAGMLNVKQALNAATKEEIRQRFKYAHAGKQNWHNLLVLDNLEASYTAMGMPLGQRGLVLPELDEVSESRIAMVFGVPLILIGSRLGLQRATYANYREARGSFWDETLIPLYQKLSSDLNRSLLPDFLGIDEVQFDLGEVQALREDEDAIHARARANVQAGIWTLEEGRIATGMPPEAEAGTYLLPINIMSTPANRGIPEVNKDAVKANGHKPEETKLWQP